MCLGRGRAAGHTATSTWAELKLPLVDRIGRELDVTWPDYGGEQVRQMSRLRMIPREWVERLTRADGWAVLIRLQSEKQYSDSLEHLTERPHANEHSDEGSADTFEWDANAKWVELLQMLLHVAGHGTVRRLLRPRLIVLLSCYDEVAVATDETPAAVLERWLPLLSAFINSNWSAGAATVWGISPLGKPLTPDSRDTDFIDDGPELQGWIVQPDGSKCDDLSLPLAWLLEAT
ncbi:hypothetical protein ACNOYE_06605 [Nannocystaceae bacterium ST9]